MLWVGAKAKIKDGAIVFREDHKALLDEYKRKNNGNEIMVEFTTVSKSDVDFSIYYKTEVLPKVTEVVNKSLVADKKIKVTLTSKEIDSMLCMKFLSDVAYKPETNHRFYYHKSFEQLNKIEQLNFLSKINLWIYEVFRITLAKPKLT